MSPPFRALVADDHPPTRAGIRGALEGSGLFEVCAEVGNATGAVAAAIRERPDVCLIDVQMPGDGITATEQISRQVPETAVVMLTVSRNDTDLLAALRAGAVGYLLKDIDPERLPHALVGVLEGEAALPRTLVARLLEEFRERPGRRLTIRGRGVNLTGREWEVLEGLEEGLTTADIARRLHMSPVTVRTHVSAIVRKLGVSDRNAAVRVARER